MAQTGEAAETAALADLLRHHRRLAGLTQEQLGEQAGLSARGIQDLERGLSLPRRDTLDRVARALRLDRQERHAFEAAARIRPRRIAPPAPAAELPLPTNLRPELTTFVGREHELSEVRRLLATARLVTLTGAGGVGKTRLALEVARSTAESYPDGVWLVELAPLSDPMLVPQAVATALGVRERPGRPLRQTLADVLRPRRLLLVLDNCEHLAGACADLTDALLRACGDLHVLATGRERLRIAGETAWRVPSLGLPPLPAASPGRPSGRLLPPRLDEVARSEAVQLFVTRAAAALPTFALSERNMLTVARICRQLDGLALAIELAAARVSALGLEQLAARLDDRFRLLTGGSRTALPRQQTLRATVAWSYALLTEPERRLFERLAVFAGGWTLAAAEAVAAGDGIAPVDVLDLLVQLVDKSLVVAQEGRGGEARYRLLETLRQYGWECLARRGAAEVARHRHVAFYLALAERAEPELTGSAPALWLRQLDEEHDNVRAALRWAIESEEAELGLRLADAVWRYWYVRGHENEGRRWLEGLLAVAQRGKEVLPATRAKALSGAAALARDQGDYERATALSEESLALFQELADERGSGWALLHLGCTARDQADYGRAAAVLEESLALFRGCGDMRGSAWALHNLARVARDQGDPGRATTLSEESLALFRERGDKRGIAFVLHHLGCVARDEGDDCRAAAFAGESLALCRDIGDSGGSAWALNNLGRTVANQGDYRRATALLKESLALALDRGDKREMVAGVEGLAAVACAQQQPERAARLFGAAHALREALCAPLPPVDRAQHNRRVAEARAQLGESAFAAIWAEGQAMAPEHAVAVALQTLATHPVAGAPVPLT